MKISKKKKRLIFILVIVLLGLFLSRNLLIQLFHRNPFEIVVINEDDGNWDAFMNGLLFRGDFNNDKFEDVLVLASPTASVDSSFIPFYLLEGGSDGTKQLKPIKVIIEQGKEAEIGSVRSAEVGDLNNDGVLDVVIVSDFETFVWFGQKAPFALRLAYVIKESKMRGTADVTIADFDSDGENELLGLDIYGRLVAYKFDNDSLVSKDLLAFFTDNKDNDERIVNLKKEFECDSVNIINVDDHFRTKMQVADIDGDKKVDLVFMFERNEHSKFLVVKNKGNGTLEHEKPLFIAGDGNSFSNMDDFFVAPLNDTVPAIVGFTHLYGNYESVGILNVFSNASHKEYFDNYSFFSSPTTYLWKEAEGIHFYITKGYFGSKNHNDILAGSRNAFFVYSPQEVTHQYENTDYLDFNAWIKSVVACDFNNNGVDEPVFLIVGRLANKDELGAYLFIYKDKIFEEQD